MSEEIIIGIDPGFSGGIAVLDGGGVEVMKMPDTEQDLLDCIRQLQQDNVFVFLENVHTMPHDSTKAATTFQQHIGALRMAVRAVGMPFELVQPTKWQREFGLLRQSKIETSTVKKNRHKSAAQQLFANKVPKIIHAYADALLIAEWGRRKRTGTLGKNNAGKN